MIDAPESVSCRHIACINIKCTVLVYTFTKLNDRCISNGHRMTKREFRDKTTTTKTDGFSVRHRNANIVQAIWSADVQPATINCG